jgi:hypothetical protein
MCGGDGQVAHHPGSQNYYERVGQDTKIMAWPVVPCPTCAAHFAAIDSAVASERERYARLVKGAQLLRSAMLDFPDDVKLMTKDIAATITVGQAIEDMRTGVAEIEGEPKARECQGCAMYKAQDDFYVCTTTGKIVRITGTCRSWVAKGEPKEAKDADKL